MTLTLEALLLIFILILFAVALALLWQNVSGLQLLLKQQHQDRLAEIKSLRSEIESLRASLSRNAGAFPDEIKRISEREQSKLEDIKNSIDALRKSLEESIKF